MSFLIPAAHAATTTAGAASSGPFGAIGGILFPLIAVGAFLMLMMYQQSKRAKQHSNLLSNLKKGDEVVTNGGLLGKISSINDNFITLLISKGTEISIQKQAIVSTLLKGTIKHLS